MDFDHSLNSNVDLLTFFFLIGYSHVRNRFRQGDDDIVVETLVELTDHESTNDGSKHPVTIHVRLKY